MLSTIVGSIRICLQSPDGAIDPPQDQRFPTHSTFSHLLLAWMKKRAVKPETPAGNAAGILQHADKNLNFRTFASFRVN